MSSSSSILPPPPQPARPSLFRGVSSSSSLHEFKNDLFPRKDKPRLYLALYPRGGLNMISSYSSSTTCDSFHWTLVVGPQSPARDEAGTCYQIEHTSTSAMSENQSLASLYEETDLCQISQAQSQNLLARITLAKVINEDRLRELLRALPPSTPLKSSHIKNHKNRDGDRNIRENQAPFNCLTWTREAYRILTADGKSLRGYIGPDDWPEIEEVARMYMKRKRRQGRFGDQSRTEGYRTWNVDEIPTWNFWENRETTD